MNDEIKEILDRIETASEIFDCLLKPEECTELLDYIINLQKEIEKLNDDKRGMLVQLYKANDEKDKIKQENQTLQENNQNMQEEMARTWQKCDDLQQENDNLTNLVKEFENKGYDISQERADFLLEIKDLQQENERLKELVDADNESYDIQETIINRQKSELLEQEDYKSRCEKANNQLKIIMQIIKEQPTRNIEDDEWLENRLIGVVNILKNGSDSKKDG